MGDITVAHWHVASGLAGYGPDAGSTTYATANTAPELADAIREELRGWADSENDGAHAYADAKDFEGAWMLAKHANSVEHVRMNLDNERMNAPVYADNPQAWDETVLGMVRDLFPYAVDEGRSKVYAWECSEPDDACEHANAED